MSVLEIADAGPALIAIETIKRDIELSCRANGVSRSVVNDYAAHYREGTDSFPSVTIFRDSKGTLWLADGFHRCAAAEAAGRTEISADVRTGSRKDALLFAASANVSHGLRRSTADKRRAVALLLGDGTWAKRSNEWLAKHAAVSPPFIAKMKATLNVSSDEPRETADGRVMDTSKIGAREPVDPLEKPLAKLKAIVALVAEQDRVRFAELALAMLTAE